jgi:hypothetical protein
MRNLKNLANFNSFLVENLGIPPKRKMIPMPKTENYWRNIIGNDFYLSGVLDSIFKKQRGYATERQYQILVRKERGETIPFHSKN